jgi:hypothetical protein
MISKYGNNGGDIFNDHCFYFETPTINDNGEADTKSMNINFGLTRDFACSYFDKGLRASGKDPDYQNKSENGKRSPSYYNSENEIEKYFGWRSEVAVAENKTPLLKMIGITDIILKLLVHLIVAKDDLKLIVKLLKF